MSGRLFSLAIATAVSALQVPDANACSIEFGPDSVPRYPWFSEPAFPTNGLFTAQIDWRSADGPLVLVADDEMSLLWGRPVARPAGGSLPSGAVFSGPDGSRLEVADGPDTTPPAAAVLAEVTTLLVRDPSDGGPFSCGDVDSLVLRVEGDDDTTPAEHLATLAMIGADETEAATKEEPDILFGYDKGPPHRDLVSTIVLGDAVGRTRDGEPFRSPTRFCFTVALMDWAGNVGERSAPQCLDTTDPNDPTVEWVDASGCACSIGPPHRSSARWLLALSTITCLLLGRRIRRV